MKKTIQNGGGSFQSAKNSCTGGCMGELLQLKGLQLVIAVVPVYPDNEFFQEVFKFGPFRTERALKDWQIRFVDCFQKEIDQEKDKISCTIPATYIEPYDPTGPVFVPYEPWVNAEEVVYMLLSWSPKKTRENLEGPLLWEGVIRLKLKNSSADVEMPVAVSPFENPDHVSEWIRRFLGAISEKRSALKGVRFQVFDENIISEGDHYFGDDEFEIEEYIISSELDPEKEGEELFNFLMRDLITSHNQMS